MVQPQSFRCRRPTEETWKAIEVTNKLTPYQEQYGLQSKPCVRHPRENLYPPHHETLCRKCKLEQKVFLRDRVQQVIDKLDRVDVGVCLKHWIDWKEYDPNATGCWQCENEAENRSPDWQTGDLQKFIGVVDCAAFIAARKRHDLQVLDEQTAIKAVREVSALIGKPRLNTTWNQNGKRYNHRVVLWKVDVEKGIKASNALVSNGITDYKITSSKWLTVWIPKELTVRECLKKR